MSDLYMSGLPASQIEVADFRLIFQLPVLQPDPNAFAHQGGRLAPGAKVTRADLRRANWEQVEDPLKLVDILDGREDATYSAPAYQEYVYFHDFAQSFLYPAPRKDARRGHLHDPVSQGLFRKDVFKRLKAQFGARHYAFSIDRHTLQFFPTGTAILSVELRYLPGETALHLSDAQTVIDHLRRSYVPFWFESDDNPPSPARVPAKVMLYDTQSASEDETAKITSATEPQEASLEHFSKDARRDPKLFDHWNALLAPLTVGPGGWRDPNDERIPLLSFIRLEDVPGTAPADLLGRIRHGDWIRIADAEEAGNSLAPYNPDFMAKTYPDLFYDRFHPGPHMSDQNATRHCFGGAHYGIVGAGWFAENILPDHFRRHYAQLALITRFEYASLLSFSARLTDNVCRIEASAPDSRTEQTFTRCLLDIRQEFLNFTHRYRFTGVSSQVQAAEMFDRFRSSLNLDTLYEDVRHEIESASDFAMAKAQEREARAATQLTELAAVGLPAGIGIAAWPIFEWRENGNPTALGRVLGETAETGRAVDAIELLVILAVLYLLTAVYGAANGTSRRILWVLGAITLGCVGLAAGLGLCL